MQQQLSLIVSVVLPRGQQRLDIILSDQVISDLFFCRGLEFLEYQEWVESSETESITSCWPDLSVLREQACIWTAGLFSCSAKLLFSNPRGFAAALGADSSG